MIETDVLVVGSGPAGSTAARFAAQEGLDVILIDKKEAIGSPKRCAEGVSTHGLERVGVEVNPRWATRRITGIRLTSPDGTTVWLTEDKLHEVADGYVVERKVFDKYMAMDAGRAGAKIYIKTLATGLRRDDDGQFIVSCVRMGEEFEIKSKILIAADGPESHISRWAGLKNSSTKVKHMESGVQYEMCNVKIPNTDVLEFYFGSVSPGGYVWIFPKEGDIANVGLAVIPEMADKPAIEYLDDFIANSPYLKDAEAVEMNVGGDPVSGIHKTISGDNILIVGDAAGTVNPLTGGGISSGMCSGMFAGQVAAKAIKEGDLSAKRLKEYDKLIDDELGEDDRLYSKVQEYMLTLNDDELNKIAVAFQDVEFDHLNTLELVKKLIKASPKAALKLGKLII